MKRDLSLYAILKKILSELNEQIVDHGERVAYLYLKMAEYRQRPNDTHLENMMLACYAHDIGAYKTEKFKDLLKFDIDHPLEHCIYGYLFMKYFSPLKDSAEVLLYHHTYFADREKYESPYLDDGILIHFLDRIDIFNLKFDNKEDLYNQALHGAGNNFNPRDVEEFIEADQHYGLIEHLRDGTYRIDVRNYFNEPQRVERLIAPIVNMLAYEIDFKSEQTVVHSITVTLFSGIIATHLGLSPAEVEEIEYAARVHDLGKIAIPDTILEKPGKLTPDEYHIMKKHMLYTDLIIGELFPDSIVRIAVRHHERLDGSGYPLGLVASELSTADRVLQVADVASALLQKRSYKDAMDKETVLDILQWNADEGKLDADIVSLFAREYDVIVPEVKEKSQDIIAAYENLQAEYQQILDEQAKIEHEAIDEFDLLPSLK